MSDFPQLDHGALDRHITGHYGEDQFRNEEKNRIWTICYADRELARELGDPNLGTVEAPNREEAIRRAEAIHKIVHRRFPTSTLWAYIPRGES